MSSRCLRNILPLSTLIFVAHELFAQGLYYESVLKGGPFQDKEQASRTYLMPGMMKHVNAGDTDVLVFRLDKQKMLSINTKNKTYWEKTFSELEKSAKAASTGMEKKIAELQEQMKEMPEAQRKMIEQMLGAKTGGGSGVVEMNSTGETRKISGFMCTRYIAKQGTDVVMTIWTTRDVKGFESLRKDYAELSKRMSAMNPRFMKGLVDAMSRIEGFPIQMDWENMSTTVTRVEQRSTPESEFTVPAGYRKEESPLDRMGEEAQPE